LADFLAQSYSPERTQQMQGVAKFLDMPAISETIDRLSYDPSGRSLFTGAGGLGGTTRFRPEVLDAAMAVAPGAGALGKLAAQGTMAAGRAGARLAERAVPQIMGRGGMGLLDDELGAAFGVFPQMKPRRRFQDREASANVPLDITRGRLAGLLGLLPDTLNFMGRSPMPTEVFGETQYEPAPQLPYGSEYYLENLPLKPTSRIGEVAGQAGAFVPLNPMPAARAVAAGARALGPTAVRMGEGYLQRQGLMPQLDVYHGSPYKYDKFDASKIGTGEGNQAYGHGIYTAENPGTAKGYQATLGHKGALDLQHESGQRGIPLSREAKVELMRQSMRDVSPKMAVKNLQNASIEARNLDPDKLAALVKDYMESKQGSFYKVDLPDEQIAKMLDWDRPLSEQPNVIKALKGTDYEVGVSQKEAEKIADMRLRQEADEWAEMTGGDPVDYSNNVDWEKYVNQVRKESGRIDSNITGKDLHSMVMRDEGYRPDLFDSENYQVGTSETLRGMGIPGIKYLDANSRGGGQGTRNFVTFPGEEQSMTILERNGQPMVAPAAEGMAHGGAVHMAGGGAAKKVVEGAVKGVKKLLGVADEVPKGVEPIVVRTPEERAVIDKFGQKQDQEAVRKKKVEKATKEAQESAGQSPEAQAAKPAKSKGPRVKVEPDVYRKMALEQGDEAVLKAVRAGEHLKPTATGYVGAPRTVTSPQGLGAMRRSMDSDFSDAVDAVRLADPERLGTWYDRAKQGIAESTEPYQLPRTLEQHGVYSAGVSPESELAFSLKHLNSRNAGDPQMAYRGAGMRNLDDAVAEQRPAKMGFKIGEYANKNDPRIPNTGLFGVDDFRRAQGMNYTDPQGNPWKAGVSETMHPFMDAETALQVDRANTAGTGGRTDWGGPQIQEVPWVYGKAQDQYGRGSSKGGRYGGDELEGIKQSIVDANNTARDYMYKHAASATHEQIPGASLGHVRQALDMTPEEKLAYGRQGRFDLPAPEAALNEYPEVGAGNRDAIYSALGYRQLPSRQAEGLYVNSLGGVETNPMTIARPLMDFPTGGGGGRMAEDSSKMMDTAEQFRALMDAQEAGAYNLPNSMDSVKGKNAMVLDTRGINPDKLADPSAGVLPTAEQLSQINKLLGEASGKAEKDAVKLREKMPYGPPTKSVARKLEGLDDAAGGYGVTATNRGALVFPYNSGSGSGGLNEIMKGAGSGLDAAFPGAQRQKAVASTGYVPGVGKRSPEGPQPTAPFSGEATSDMLRAFSEMHPTVAQNLSESESVRAAIRDKALRDSKMGGTRKDIQETRRFFSEADWPRAVEMIRKGMTPAAALAALGYSASSMAGDKR